MSEQAKLPKSVEQFEVYVCGCGEELSVYDIDPVSITDVGADRREDTGNYYCPECEQDYEPITVATILAQRDAEWRSALLGDEAVEAALLDEKVERAVSEVRMAVNEEVLDESVRDLLRAALDKAAPDGGGGS